MKKLLSATLLLLFCQIPVCMGQLLYKRYHDFPGQGVRKWEANSTKSLKNSVGTTAGLYLLTQPTTTIEKASRTRLYPNSSSIAYINYLKYEGLCNYYVSPFKKSRCNNRLNYLKEAHKRALKIVQLPGVDNLNRGVKEQIFEKYTSITNTIFFELEKLKIEVDEETYYRQILFGH